MKTKFMTVRLTEEQVLKLKEIAIKAGFKKKSDYIRYVLFKLTKESDA